MDKEQLTEATWYLYILRCGDGSLYTGITTDVLRRLQAHRRGVGAKYTRGRGPLELMYRECCGTHSQALRRELEVKALSRPEKEALCCLQPTDRPRPEPEFRFGQREPRYSCPGDPLPYEPCPPAEGGLPEAEAE